TPAGDVAELCALGRALGQQRSAPLPVGSVKTNIGHAEGAAGVCGLIKAALSLWHGLIPARLHLESPNPKVAFDELGVRIASTLESWTGRGRIAGVSSFGLTGTNAHLLLASADTRGEEISKQKPTGHIASDASAGPTLVALSAHTEG